MIFTPLQYDSGKIKKLLVKNGESIAKGDPLKFDDGLCEKADNLVTEVRFVALEAITDAVSADNDAILAIRTNGIEFEAETKENTTQTNVDVVCDLHSDGTVKNDGTGNAFLITQTVGPNTDKKVRGYFLDRTAGSG